MPRKSDALTVAITARISPGAPHGEYLAYSARIETSPELEVANNEVQASLLVGVRIHLPLIVKIRP